MKKEEINSKLIYYLSLIGFFAIFSTTISKSPVLPLYTKALGGTDFVIGLVSAFSPLAGILFSFPIGLMSDKIGRKKLLIVSGIIFLISPLLYLSVSSPGWLIPIRFFHGVATAILGPVTAAMIVGTYSKNKGEKLGIYSSSTLIGRTLAPLLGGFIISYFANPGISIISYKYVYIAAFILSLPVFFLVLFLKEDKKNKSKVQLKDFYIDLKYFISNKKLFSTSLVEMATYFSYGAFETYLPVYLSQNGVPAYKIGLIFSIQILSIAGSKPLFGKLADRIDKRIQIIFGILTLGIAIGIIGFFSTITSAIIIGIIFGLGLSFSTIATSTYIAEITDKDKLGASLGGLSSIMDIGQGVGPFITGIIITYFSFKQGFLISLIVAIISGVIFSIYNWKKE
ncbi:Multidrug resistance protein MdtG [uncultured archaeon]|nr:Multidrug resistance protein MdtG [uncultured archaeon]